MTYSLDTTQKIDRVVSYIISQIGKPYKSSPQPPKNWSPGTLMSSSWKTVGVDIPSSVKSQYRSMSRVKNVSVGSTDNLQPGDLIFFLSSNSESVSMYIGGGNVVEVSTSTGVRQVALWNTWNSSNFSLAARPKGIGIYGGTDDQADKDTPRKDENNNNFQPTIRTTKNVRKNSVAVSDIYGTPRTARFAVMNLANETIYLKQTGNELGFSSDSWIKSKPIILGNEKEIIIEIANSNDPSNVDISSKWIQSQEQAEAVGSLLSNSLKYRFKTISLEIFGNPLIQLGDIVKFNYSIGSYENESDVLYVVTSIITTFDKGLSTSVTLRPLTETISTV